MPPKTLEDLAKDHGLETGVMTIEGAVSQFPRDILLPKCPKCGKWLYLYHSQHRPDPFIGAKVLVGPLKEFDIKPGTWIAADWTDGCDYYLELDKYDLAECPRCHKRLMELFSLYDHMKFQCDEKARDDALIRKAGAGMYLAGLVPLEFVEDVIPELKGGKKGKKK